ncbi:uncharacterized protein MONOS_9930 [Monocercomonoides exilis]|uniref:uncharacterized protein n=1 Tax=Monocercomonoides exilis TaxID=2049356 RepID=UPI00355AC361|nr:hypothetical protein MONOS_9930 [Monocercomonoides exilis]|eukprot:MONOS_9930.1-p1 / transcript=MONOS_9930.1 / gene=MONOS_9930 / organism=Monocercomonoides_exilis_PA203 / gene_product=unspecified product / transcript_product=unspecified product / location=Mono_scaffold00428:42975-43387(-) / protein_length=87 / sequence_SO=supercontig / SO=protein_coding / is_pseudo=false
MTIAQTASHSVPLVKRNSCFIYLLIVGLAKLQPCSLLHPSVLHVVVFKPFSSPFHCSAPIHVRSSHHFRCRARSLSKINKSGHLHF